MKAIGILLLIGAGIFGLFTVSEYSRYQGLVDDGNPFAGMVGNSWLYCGGIAMTAFLCGIGFLVAPTKAKVPVALPVSGANPYDGMAWDGKSWTPAAPPSTPAP